VYATWWTQEEAILAHVDATRDVKAARGMVKKLEKAMGYRLGRMRTHIAFIEQAQLQGPRVQPSQRAPIAATQRRPSATPKAERAAPAVLATPPRLDELDLVHALVERMEA
jgi:hypothetical protein